MIKIEFTQEEIEQLHHERRHHPRPRVRQRMEVQMHNQNSDLILEGEGKIISYNDDRPR